MGLSQVGYITEMHGEKFNITVTNAPAYYLEGNNNITLKPCSLIISSPTNANWYDIGTPSLLATDKHSNILRLTYAVKYGDGLLIEKDSIRLGIDKETIQTNKSSLLYVSAADLIAYSGKSILAKKIGDDIHDNRTYLVVNPEGFTDNLSLKTFSKTEGFIENNDLNPDLLYVNNNFLIDNISLKTSIIEDKILRDKILGNNDNTHPSNTNNDLYISYCTKLSVNIDNIIDNKTLTIHSEDIPSTYLDKYNYYNESKNLTSQRNVIQVETENLARATNENFGVVKVSKNIVSSGGSISVDTQLLERGTNASFGVVKVDNNTIKSNNGLIYADTNSLQTLMKSTNNSIFGTVKGDGTYTTTSDGIVTLSSNFRNIIDTLTSRIITLENQTGSHYFNILGDSNFSDIELSGKTLIFYIDDQSGAIELTSDSIEWEVDNENVSITNTYIENDKHYCEITIGNNIESSFNFILSAKAAAVKKYDETTRSIPVSVNKTEKQNQNEEYVIDSIILQKITGTSTGSQIYAENDEFYLENVLGGDKFKVIVNIGNIGNHKVDYSISSGDINKIGVESTNEYEAIVLPSIPQSTSGTTLTININSTTVNDVVYQSTIKKVYITIDASVKTSIEFVYYNMAQAVLHHNTKTETGHLTNVTYLNSYIYFGEEDNSGYLYSGYFSIPFKCTGIPENYVRDELEVSCSYSNSVDNGKISFRIDDVREINGKINGTITCNYNAPFKGYITQLKLKFNGSNNYMASSAIYHPGGGTYYGIYILPGIPGVASNSLNETIRENYKDYILIQAAQTTNLTQYHLQSKIYVDVTSDIIRRTLLKNYTCSQAPNSLTDTPFTISLSDVYINGTSTTNYEGDVIVNVLPVENEMYVIRIEHLNTVQIQGKISFHFKPTYINRKSINAQITAESTQENTPFLYFKTKESESDYGYDYNYDDDTMTNLVIKVSTKLNDAAAPQGDHSYAKGYIEMDIIFDEYDLNIIQTHTQNGSIDEYTIANLFNLKCEDHDLDVDDEPASVNTVNNTKYTIRVKYNVRFYSYSKSGTMTYKLQLKNDPDTSIQNVEFIGTTFETYYMSYEQSIPNMPDTPAETPAPTQPEYEIIGTDASGNYITIKPTSPSDNDEPNTNQSTLY